MMELYELARRVEMGVDRLIEENERLLARIEMLEKIGEAGAAVLYHDERGQGIGYKEAMDALHAALQAAKEGG